MKAGIAWPVPLFLAVCFGCASVQKVPEEMITQREDPVVLQALVKSINTRIRILTHVREQVELSSQDKAVASDLLATYRKLQRNLSGRGPVSSGCLGIIEQTYHCLSMLDAVYFSDSKKVSAHGADILSAYTRRKADIMDAYLTGDYREVIDLTIQLNSNFGPDALTPDTGLVFAVSLAKNGMLDEAIDIGEKMARQMASKPDLLQLLAHIAEWYLLRGQREEAVSIYEKLSDTCEENAFTLRSLNKKVVAPQISRPDIKPEIPEPVPLERLMVGIAPLIEEVNQFLEQNRFNEARNLLISARRRPLKTDEIDAVNQALKKVETSENDYLEKKISVISLKRDMKQAKKLLEEESFAEVIARLEVVETEFGEVREVTELKQFAIEKLITRERNRAAGIFLAAKKTSDVEKKQVYLMEALEILNSILSTYPSSGLNNKIISNIETVKIAIERLPRKVEKPSDP